MHVCMSEIVWRGMLAFPHVLSHAHMLSTSSLTGCACSCEGGHVERHTLTFPQVLPHTHTVLSGLSPASVDQGVKNGFSDLTKEQEGQDWPRKDIMNRH